MRLVVAYPFSLTHYRANMIMLDIFTKEDCMSLVEMQNIRKNYHLGETVVHALQGIDLTIDTKEFVAIWGPSGSGKTTLLNLIGAIDEPTGGKLSIAGTDVHSLPDNKRSELRNETIGYIFQGFNLVPVLSALENVMLPLQIKGASLREAKEKALYRLQEVGLREFTHHRPSKMSGGQQQRVAIARALVNDPSLVIADEPTANLDSETARMIISIMRDLNEKDAITFIFSTHDQRLLDRVKRLVRLEDGRIMNGDMRKPNEVFATAHGEREGEAPCGCAGGGGDATPVDGGARS
jgi:putative ABC transport system ATP-binding protein